MRIKLDENLPEALAEVLRDLGHDVDSVPAEGLAGATDERVVAAARRDDRILFTLDKSIGDPRRYSRSTRGGIVIFRSERRGPSSSTRAVLAAMPRLVGRALRGRVTVVTATSIRTHPR